MTLVSPSGEHSPFKMPLSAATVRGSSPYPYLKGYSVKQSKELDDLDTMIKRLNAEIRQARASAESHKYLKAEECENVSQKLEAHKVSRGWIVLGYVFFLFIIPAILAYQASQANAVIQDQMQKLAELSQKLKQLQEDPPEKLLGDFVQKIEAFKAEQVALQLDMAEAKGKIEQDRLDRRLIAIQEEIDLITAQIHSMVTDHGDLALLVPEDILPRLPSKDDIDEAVALAADVSNSLTGLSVASSEAASAVASGAAQASGEPKAEGSGLTATGAGAASVSLGAGVASIKASIATLSPEALAVAARDQAIERAQADIQSLFKKVRVGSFGIENAGNTCYMASVIQSMRWNPVIRYFVFRDLPESEFCGFDETGTRPVLKKDTVAFRDYRRNVQAQLREVFTTLDQGRGVSTAQMAAFRRVMGSIGGDTSKWATTQQQDAQEFQNHLEDLLLKSTIEVPGTKDCLVSGLQEAVRTEIRILPDEGILKPAAAGAGKDRYIVSGSVGYRNMYPLSLEVTRASQTSAPQVARSFNSGRVRSTLERPDEVEDVPYLMQTTYTHEDALALRARVQESEKVTRVDYDRARTGAFVELERRGNPYRVGRCQKVQEVVRNPPSIGVIAVRQAINTRDLTRPWRVGGVVPFPESFERKDLESSSPEAKVTYDLVSCVCHSGGSTLSSGHYIAYAKINGSWYCFNDGSVTKASDFNPLTNPNIYTVQYMKRVESAAGIIA